MAAPARLDRRMGDTDALMLRLERSALLRSTIVQVALIDQPPDAGLNLAGPVARVLNTVPSAFVVPAFEYVMRGIDVILSNMPGSPLQLYVAGARSLGNYGFAPRAGAALNITIISHLGELHVAVNSDPAAVGDPEDFMSCLQDGFDEIRKVA